MLVLTRRTGATILIGDDIEITVLVVDGNQVRVGIEAPTMSRFCGAKVASRRFARDTGTCWCGSPPRFGAVGLVLGHGGVVPSTGYPLLRPPCQRSCFANRH